MTVNSVDISQSVFRRFLRKWGSGTCELERPEQLLALLITMTRNRVADWARKLRVEQRLLDEDFELQNLGKGCGTVCFEADPRQGVEDRELAAEIRARMSPREYELFRRRASGDSWEAIGREFAESPEALRKRLERGLARVRKEINRESPNV